MTSSLTSPSKDRSQLDRLKTSGGSYAMLALDQRESLRGMFMPATSGHAASDQQLREFKLAATKVLTPAASGVLLDRLYALDDESLEAIDDDCGLVVAVDTLVQEAGQPVTSTKVDTLATADYLQSINADAVKFLVMWRSPQERSVREALIEQVLELAAEANVASLIEAVVLPPEGLEWGDMKFKNEAILQAAEEMSAFPMDVYKAQVPGYFPGDLSEVNNAAVELNRIIGREWVVLSNGVRIDDFAQAVAESCRGGASGFLAGRAIWSDLVGVEPLEGALTQVARPRLEHLSGIVDSITAPREQA